VIGGNREVLRAILFEPVAMKLVAIHLDCKDAVDDQVDPLRIAQSHLRNDIVARQPGSGAGQLLREVGGQAIQRDALLAHRVALADGHGVVLE